MRVATPFLERNMHPTIITTAYMLAMTEALEYMKHFLTTEIDLNDSARILEIVKSSIATKYTSSWGDLICELAIKGVRTVRTELDDGTFEIDTKRYVRVERVTFFI